MGTSTVSGPFRSENGFQELVNGQWVPVAGSGGGGGSTTFIDLDEFNRYTSNYIVNPPTGPTAGNIIQLPVIEVGSTYTVLFNGQYFGLDAWAIQLPTIPNTDVTSFVGAYNVKVIGGDSPLYTVQNEYSTTAGGPADIVYIYGIIDTPMQIIRLDNITVPGFGVVALFQQLIPPGMNITPYPDPFVYPFTNLITP